MGDAHDLLAAGSHRSIHANPHPRGVLGLLVEPIPSHLPDASNPTRLAPEWASIQIHHHLRKVCTEILDHASAGRRLTLNSPLAQPQASEAGARIVQLLLSRRFNYQGKHRIRRHLNTLDQIILDSVNRGRPVPIYLDLGGGYHAATGPGGIGELTFDASVSELLVVSQFASLDHLVRKIYPPGISVGIIIDNLVANYVNDVPIEFTEAYCDGFQTLIDRLQASAFIRLIVESRLPDWRGNARNTQRHVGHELSDQEYYNVVRFLGRPCSVREARNRILRYSEATKLSEAGFRDIVTGAIRFVQQSDDGQLTFRPFPGGAARVQAGRVGFWCDDVGVRPRLVTGPAKERDPWAQLPLDLDDILPRAPLIQDEFRTNATPVTPTQRSTMERTAATGVRYSVSKDLLTADEVTDFRQTTSCFHAFEVNPALGCDFGCRYCSMYSQDTSETHFPMTVFSKYVHHVEEFIKSNEKPSKLIFNFSPKTDVFSPVLMESGVTEKILEILARYGVKFYIITKGGLPNRRIRDLLVETREVNQLIVSSGLKDEAAEALLEPGAPRSSARMEMARWALAEGIAVTGILAPYLPLLDDDTDARAILSRFADAGIPHVSVQVLKLSRESLDRICELLPKNADRLREVFKETGSKPINWRVPGGASVTRYYANSTYLAKELHRMKRLAAELGMTVSACTDVCVTVGDRRFNREGLSKGFNCVGFRRE